MSACIAIFVGSDNWHVLAVRVRYIEPEMPEVNGKLVGTPNGMSEMKNPKSYYSIKFLSGIISPVLNRGGSFPYYSLKKYYRAVAKPELAAANANNLHI